MKLVLCFGVLCLMSVVIAKKEEASNIENVDDTWSMSEHSQHQAKKYKDPKAVHHHHSKHKKYLDNSEYQQYEKIEGKKAKHIPKQAPHEISPEEAELQANLHTSKKHLKDHNFKEAQQDLHLQDLTFEENLRKEEKHSKSPHHYQRGQHKTGHFSENSKQVQPEVESKLFGEQNPKEHIKHKHPILEDSFETLQDKKPKQDGKKHSKKYNKYKKQSDKMKKDKTKSYKKEKKNKKEKKQKNW